MELGGLPLTVMPRPAVTLAFDFWHQNLTNTSINICDQNWVKYPSLFEIWCSQGLPGTQTHSRTDTPENSMPPAPKVSDGGKYCSYWAPTDIGGNLGAEVGLEAALAARSMSTSWLRSRMISAFCSSTTLHFSSSCSCITAFLLVVVAQSSASAAARACALFLRWMPSAASRSCAWVRASLSSRRRSLISLISVTFSCDSPTFLTATKSPTSAANSRHSADNTVPL